ncbi:hypothetical protein [Kitasatospora sp. NPDC097643]|uniref:hypothetical protein n=1 Tax=Kitasatospora sp. NPDC097643 TaxID=3157230 RepID=UPI00331B741B
MAEIQPTSAATPKADAKTPEASAPTVTVADTKVVADGASTVAGYIVPADEKHQDPQELFGGEVTEPEHAEDKPGETVPLGAINAHP